MRTEEKCNCWEFKSCGREPGGSAASQLGICPASTATEFDGLHHGTNAGRVCWAVSGTLCGGDIQGSFASKIGNCVRCDFFQEVHRQESRLLSFTEIFAALQATEASTQTGPPSTSATVLVVDDCHTIRRAIRGCLEKEYRVLEAADGEEGLAVFLRDKVDAVVLDIEMPRQNGLQTCDLIRNSPNGRRTPVIFITGKDAIEYRTKAFESGAIDFISKLTAHFLDEVAATIGKVLRPSERFKGFTALLVEDNPTVATLISSMLDQLGVTVIEEKTEPAAMAIIGSPAVDLDLLITASGTDTIQGASLSRFCRSQPKLRTIPIIALCRDGQAQANADLFHAGATDYLIVPFSRSELNARLRTHLESRFLMKRLAAEMQKNSMILHSAKEGILAVDVHGRITVVNQAAASMLGWRPDEMIGQSFHDLAHHTTREGMPIPAEDCPISKSFTMGTATEINDDIFWRKDGTSLPVRYTCSPVIEETTIEGAVVTFSDMTAQRQSEALREDVEHITRHDLKAPLNAIIGFPSLIKNDENLTEQQRQYLQMIESSGYRMLNMINGSLTLYKIEKGLYTPDPVKVNLIEILQTVCREIARQFKSKGLTIVFQGEDSSEVPVALHVLGEEMLCYSMLENLMVNAYEASPRSEAITISLRRHERMAEVAIQNQGEVPEEIRERFFDKLVTAGKKSGTGLGTYSARLMARAQGGDLSMQSGKGVGTILRVTLPLVQS